MDLVALLRGGWGRAAALRTALFALIWLVLTENISGAWAYGLPVVALGVWLSLRLAPPAGRTGSLRGLLVAVPYVLWKSVAGGVDVALRALHPALPIEPDFVEVPLQSTEGRLPIALAYVMTVMPGTLVADFTERGLRLHVVDRRLPVLALTEEVQERLKRTLGTDAEERHGHG